MDGGKRDGALMQLDRSGAAGAIDNSRGKVNLANAITFEPGRRVMVYRRGRWEQVTANEFESTSDIPLLHSTFRLPEPRPATIAVGDRVRICEDGIWRCGVMNANTNKKGKILAVNSDGTYDIALEEGTVVSSYVRGSV